MARNQVIGSDRIEPGCIDVAVFPRGTGGSAGWKLQAEGGLMGLGTSPSSIDPGCRARPISGFGIGTAESSAPVYGCFGLAYSSSRLASLGDLARGT